MGHPEAFEGCHQQYPDFRVGKKIFAFLGLDETWDMVRLSPVGHFVFVNEDIAHKPATGAWGGFLLDTIESAPSFNGLSGTTGYRGQRAIGDNGLSGTTGYRGKRAIGDKTLVKKAI